MIEKMLKEKYNISDEIIEKYKSVSSSIEGEINKIKEISFINQMKVLDSMQKNKLSDIHLNATTGYGYNDIGRDVIEKIYADIFNAEDALVRTQIVSGTHAISIALFAILRPGDELLSINGKPYDTLDEVIGISENVNSLKSFGIKYSQIELENDRYDNNKIKEYLSKNKVKLVIMQRSKGYAWRKSFNIDEIGEVIKIIKDISPNTIVMVDNCYGEFVETEEPTDVGADLVVGSLIKNIGGGLANTGGYIVGKKELIDMCSQRYSAPGIGKECGATIGQNRNILQGIFMAPHIVGEAIKTAIFSSKMFEELGYESMPKYNEKRTDIVQALKFNDKNKLIKFCQGIQRYSPIDSSAIPEPWEMPGYTDQVIMAAGTFVQGATLEMSADAPIRQPYIAYIQGSLTYESGCICIIRTINDLQGEKI